MKLTFTKTYTLNPMMLIRRCGYGQKRGKTTSYVRRVGVGDFPRFHAYLEKIEGGFFVNLHLDQKAACYGAQTAHSGEYGGEVVEQEARRIQSMIDRSQRKS